jgi:hypothetical protein
MKCIWAAAGRGELSAAVYIFVCSTLNQPTNLNLTKIKVILGSEILISFF